MEAEQTDAQRTDAQQKDVQRKEELQTNTTKAESWKDQTNTEGTISMEPAQEWNIKLTQEEKSSMEATISMVSTAAPQEVINKKASIKFKKIKKAQNEKIKKALIEKIKVKSNKAAYITETSSKELTKEATLLVPVAELPVAETEPVAVPEAEAKPVPVDIKEDEATLLVPVAERPVAETEPVAGPEAEAKPVPVDSKEDEATLLVPVHIKDELLPHVIKEYMPDLSMGPQAEEYNIKMEDELLLCKNLIKERELLLLLRKDPGTRVAELLRKYHDKALNAEVKLKDPDKKLVVELLRKDPDKNKGDVLLKDHEKNEKERGDAAQGPRKGGGRATAA